MKKTSHKYSWITMLIVSSLYFSCRKMDSLHKNSETSVAEIETRFFREHASTDPTVLKLMNYIERKNTADHFVTKTVERIGYPFWDKTLIVQKPQGNEQLRQTVNSIRSNEVGRADNDPTNIYYVPFVRDEQNQVNASLVIRTSPTDTSFNYVCDWQYKDKGHGSPSSDATAENHALFFMMLDNRTLGHREFKIKDTRLFSKPGDKEGWKKITLDVKRTDGVGTNSAVYERECLSYGFCGSPQACYERGGCDWATGCSAGCCYPDEYCIGWWEFDRGGGSIGNGFSGDGSNDNNGGGGTTGSGGSNNAPPDCSDPANKHEGDCEEGWVPVDDPYSPEKLEEFGNAEGWYWEDPANSAPIYPYDPSVDGSRRSDGFRRNGKPIQYSGGTVQNWTDDSGNRVATFTSAAGSVDFPNAYITDNLTPKGSGYTMADGTIRADNTFDLAALQHEYGHFLQAQKYGKIHYNKIIIPASLKSAIVDIDNHKFFWTEKEANLLSLGFFGPGSAIANNSHRFPIR